MLNTVSSCHDQLESLQKLKNMIGPETWCDCLRLVDRCEIFRPFLKDLLSSVELLEDISEKEEKHLNDLEKTLLDAELYVKEFVLRPDYFGITECTYRQGCSIDFSKVVRNVIKLAQDLNVGSDTDFDKLRTEDLEDIRKTLEYSYLKVAEEIEQVPSKERLICALFKDLESYQYIIMKFLALNKHMALTVSETKMLKSDTDRIRKVLEARFPRRPEVVSTVELVPYKAASASRSHDNTLSDDSSASSATSAGSGSTIRTDNSEESIIIDNALASKLIRQEALTTEQAARRMKTLSKLRLQTEDVLISTIKIGQGGFGDIVLGNYKRKFKCAIKTVANVDDPLSDSKRQTIENELLIMKYLGKYRTILQCYGYLMSRNDMHIVLELSPYGSLDKLLKEATIEEFPINLTLAWMKDLADAMRFLHEHDIRHRDLKAENMLLFDKLTIKLCDFGPAKHHLSNVTADDNSGIICFLAPETRVGQVTDLSADIFSFAMTVIQIMTRKNPKIDHFKDQVVDALMKVTITNANVSRKLHSLLTSCVAYDPSVVSQSTIRPTAETVFMTLHELLENDLGGDPRFLSDNGSKETAFIKDIEVVAYMKQNDRLKKAPKSGTLFRGRSGASGKSGSGYKKNMKAVSYDQYEQSSFEKAADYSSSHNKTNYSTYSNATGGPNMSVNYTSYSVNQTNFTANNDPQTIEDKNQMVKFLRTEIKLTLSQSIQVAEILVRNGVINVTVLRRRLIRNKDFLLDIGLDDDSSLDILEYMISTAKDQAEIDNLRSSKRYSRRFGRENQDIVAKLPNETARLYYEASQCNRSEALIALRELESSGDQLAQGFIMRMMAMGQGGIKKDHKAADEMGKRLFPWLQDAVARGSTDIVMYARYLLGVCYSEGLGIKQDLREAIRWYKLSSSQGYNAAQAYLGYCYFTGTGIPRNIDEALRYYKLGAELGHAGAQCNLGLCYEHGYGVAKDKEAAVKWYTHAAEQGDIAALFNLGYCCERGHGVPENIHQAVKYYKASASAGYTAAQHNLGLCYYFGNGVDQNISEAVVWLRLSAEKGYAPAQCKLGLCFENGHGVRQDFSEAVYWYRQSAEQGDAAALYYLGFCYFSGTGVELNYEEAVRYYKESAAKNYPPALNNLGFCYFNGMGLTKNYTMAVKYYRQSAELGYAPAQYNMGYCYEKGFGVVKKLNTVIKWYRLASENGNEKAKKELAKYQAL